MAEVSENQEHNVIQDQSLTDDNNQSSDDGSPPDDETTISIPDVLQKIRDAKKPMYIKNVIEYCVENHNIDEASIRSEIRKCIEKKL